MIVAILACLLALGLTSPAPDISGIPSECIDVVDKENKRIHDSYTAQLEHMHGRYLKLKEAHVEAQSQELALEHTVADLKTQIDQIQLHPSTEQDSSRLLIEQLRSQTQLQQLEIKQLKSSLEYAAGAPTSAKASGSTEQSKLESILDRISILEKATGSEPLHMLKEIKQTISTAELPYSLNCSFSHRGHLRVWENCNGTHREYARAVLGDQCMDIKIKVFLTELMITQTPGGPAASMNAVANTLDVMGIKTWKFHDPALKGEVLSGDETEYNILWAPIWYSTEFMSPYLADDTPYSYKVNQSNYAVVLGPNVNMPGELWTKNYRHEHTHLTFPSWWAVQKHKFAMSDEQLRSTIVKPFPTFIDDFHYNPTTFCSKHSRKLEANRPPLSDDIRTAKCVFYTKSEAPDVMTARRATQQALDALGLDCHTMNYGSYGQADFSRLMCSADFVIVSDFTETQGYAQSEIMALDVPLFFVSSGMNENRVSLTVPYFCEECGAFYQPAIPFQNQPITAMAHDIAAKLRLFWKDIIAGKFAPRKYVQRELSMMPMFLNMMAGFCDMIGIRTAQPVPPIRTMWPEAFYSSEGLDSDDED